MKFRPVWGFTGLALLIGACGSSGTRYVGGKGGADGGGAGGSGGVGASSGGIGASSGSGGIPAGGTTSGGTAGAFGGGGSGGAGGSTCVGEVFPIERTPLAIYIMLDKSGSMLAPGSNKWQQATTAINAFASDPTLAGVKVALQTWSGAGPCDGT